MDRSNSTFSAPLRFAAVVLGLVLSMLMAEFALRFPEFAGNSRLLPRSYSIHQIEAAGSGNAALMFEPDLGWVTAPGLQTRAKPP